MVSSTGFVSTFNLQCLRLHTYLLRQLFIKRSLIIHDCIMIQPKIPIHQSFGKSQLYTEVFVTIYRVTLTLFSYFCKKIKNLITYSIRLVQLDDYIGCLFLDSSYIIPITLLPQSAQCVLDLLVALIPQRKRYQQHIH